MLASPLEQDTKVDINDLTHASVEGNGVFDVLMRAVNAHLQKEWSANRLKGTEYSTVYLGALESTMNASLQFLLARDKTNAELDILKQQLVNLKVEEANATKQGVVLTNQAAQIAAQTSLTTKQELQVVAETLNVPKQGQLIDANRLNTEAQTIIANTQSAQDLLNKQAQVVSMGKDNEVKDRQALQIAAQTAQINAETLNIPKQGLLIDAQKETQLQQKLNLADELLTAAQQRTNLSSENQAIIAKTSNTAQQTANLLAEAANIPKQGAVYDSTKSKVDVENALLTDKLTTEASQRTVLAAQASGYKRDAEQKAAEIMTRAFAAIATTTGMDSAAAAGYGISQVNVAASVSKLITNS